MIYDNNGKVREFAEPFASKVNVAYPIKLVYQKYYSLFILQRIVGVSNADTIGMIESYANLKNNKLKVFDMGAYIFGDKNEEPIN